MNAITLTFTFPVIQDIIDKMTIESTVREDVAVYRVKI